MDSRDAAQGLHWLLTAEGPEPRPGEPAEPAGKGLWSQSCLPGRAGAGLAGRLLRLSQLRGSCSALGLCLRAWLAKPWWASRSAAPVRRRLLLPSQAHTCTHHIRVHTNTHTYRSMSEGINMRHNMCGAHIHAHMYTCIHTRAQTCVSTHAHTYEPIHTHAHTLRNGGIELPLLSMETHPCTPCPE